MQVAPSHANDLFTPTSSDVFLETDYIRDPYGLIENVIQSGSATARMESITYDTLDHTFPLKRTNAAGHEETTHYHSGLGVVVSQDDHYGIRTAYQYDGFGRLRTIDLPSLSDVSISYSSGYGSAGNVAGQAIIRTVAQSSNRSHDPREMVIYDRLGRPSLLGTTAKDPQKVPNR